MALIDSLYSDIYAPHSQPFLPLTFSHMLLKASLGLEIRSLVFHGNRSFFDKKERTTLFALFVKSEESEPLLSLFLVKQQRERFALVIRSCPSFKKSDLLFFVIYFLFLSPVFSFLFKNEQSSLLKRANPPFALRSFTLFIKSDKSESL